MDTDPLVKAWQELNRRVTEEPDKSVKYKDLHVLVELVSAMNWRYDELTRKK